MNAQAQEKTAQMHWEKLITSKRFGMEQYHDDRHHTRTDFQRDYDRLVFSACLLYTSPSPRDCS